MLEILQTTPIKFIRQALLSLIHDDQEGSVLLDLKKHLPFRSISHEENGVWFILCWSHVMKVWQIKAWANNEEDAWVLAIADAKIRHHEKCEQILEEIHCARTKVTYNGPKKKPSNRKTRNIKNKAKMF